MHLWHFTDARNLDSIRLHGLLAWPLLRARNISHVPGSNELSRNLDRRFGWQDYVRLCLGQDHPMASTVVRDGRVRDLVWLRIDPAAGRWSTTRFSDDNAASTRATVNADPRMAYDSLCSQAEVLVHRRIDPRWITFP